MTYNEYIALNDEYGVSKEIAFHVEYIEKALFLPAGGFQYQHKVIYGAINTYKFMKELQNRTDIYMYQIYTKPRHSFITAKLL